MLKSGQHIREGYGLSETSPILTVNPMHVAHFSGAVGVPMPSTDIKLLDGDDNEVGIGEEGEVCAFGPQVMQGYWNRPDANKEAFDAMWQEAGINGLNGHRSVGGYRASMYNALPLESVQVLVDVMKEFTRKNG